MDVNDFNRLRLYVKDKRWFLAKPTNKKFGKGLSSRMASLGWAYARMHDNEGVWFNPSAITIDQLDQEYRHVHFSRTFQR